jgi:hypothetical protein
MRSPGATYGPINTHAQKQARQISTHKTSFLSGSNSFFISRFFHPLWFVQAADARYARQHNPIYLSKELSLRHRHERLRLLYPL